MRAQPTVLCYLQPYLKDHRSDLQKEKKKKVFLVAFLSIPESVSIDGRTHSSMPCCTLVCPQLLY